MRTELRKTGISVVGDIPWGTHLCHFYETKEDLLDILIPYFRAGLENNELCVWVLAEPVTEEEAREALRRGVPEAERYLSAGQMEIMPHSDWYLKGGAFDGERVVEDWNGKLDEALAKGFTGMRGNGIGAGLVDKYREDVLKFDRSLDKTLAGKRMIILCSYPLAEAHAAEVFDVVQTHESALARRRDIWEVIESTDLKRARREIERLNEELEQRVVERTRELAAANEELKKEIVRRKLVEEALRESEERFRRAFISNPAVNVICSFPHGRFLHVNDAFVRTFGYAQEEAVGKTSVELGLWPDPGEREELVRMARGGELLRRYEARLRSKSGDLVDALIYTEMIELAGAPHLLVMVSDITEGKRAEEQLRQSESQLAEAQQLAHVGSWSLDLRTNSVTWSDELYRIFGVRPSEFDHKYEAVIGTTHPEDREWLRNIIETSLKTHEPFSAYYRIILPTGELRVLHAQGAAVTDERGNATRLYGTAQDVTERMQAEERLRATTKQLRALSARIHSAKEEEGTRIAREIHDELGAALSSLRWYLEDVDEGIAEASDDARLQRLRQKIADMMKLTDTTVDVVRRIASELRPAALDDLGLAEAIEWQAQQFEARTGIAVLCACHQDEIKLSREQSTAVFRIFQEALTNVQRHARATKVDVTLKSEAGVLTLTIRDDGRGITDEEQRGAHTLGLLGMRERAKLVGGELDIKGIAGRGTTVTVRVTAVG